ncbi:MAG: methyltransferase [Amycolatopsis sp.]|uniref:class I SAM-dependent methyltransferase n=1 Tax=Amycolatopsis sp. TaxID=37632 RepID=UPI002631581E|nr:methyltransferase domain-containing protein [Amycolatopsis sp.]MCU1686724.1 methyltransferase [Amycolatopsis sp.]
MSADDRHAETITRVFDDAAAEFDTSGLDFFTPLGKRLADLAGSGPGDRVLDVGCGMGSSLIPAAERVGPTGFVTGIDLAPEMARRLAAILLDRKVTNVRVLEMDGERPDFPDNSFEIIQAGFSVMHFSSAPASLSRYPRLLGRGGRFCYSELVDEDGLPDLVPREAFAELEPFFPTELPNPRERGLTPWNRSAESIRGALLTQGFARVNLTEETSEVDVGSGRRWNAWTMSTGLRQAWANVPTAELDAVQARTAALIEQKRDVRGRLLLPVRVRYVACETGEGLRG